MLRTKSDSLMAGVDHSWEDWFAGDPGFKTNSTSPFDFTKSPPSEPSGFVHLLRHGVDIGQAMKTGPLWYRVDGAEADRTNAQAALEWADAYLHRADGMYWGDEEVEGVSSPSRGTETCSIVETMFSMRVAYEVTGNISFMDRLELVAFNSLPAALWPDATTNVYHHANNQIETGGGAPYAYDLYFCCSANVHQGCAYLLGLGSLSTLPCALYFIFVRYTGRCALLEQWPVSRPDRCSLRDVTPRINVFSSGPKFMLSAVHLQGGDGAAGSDDTIVISGYAPSSSTLADGTTVAVTGTYPFADNATVAVSAAARLRLRIPCWAEGAAITVVAGGETTVAPPCAFFNVTTTAAATISVRFHTQIRLHVVKQSSLHGQGMIQPGGVEVHRGALLYALRPASVESAGDPAVSVAANLGLDHSLPNQPYPGSLPGGGAGWPVIGQHVVTIAPNTSWNYGLQIDSLTFEQTGEAVPALPFDAHAAPPVQIRVKGQTLPGWTTAGGARGIAQLPASPLSSPSAVEELVLVPYGSTNIRVSVFPQLCAAGSPSCPAPSPPNPAPGPAPGPLCHPTGTLPPNVQLDMNLPAGDLPNAEGGITGDQLGPAGTFNATECYARCLIYNSAGNGSKSGASKCTAWTATARRKTGQAELPWCWLKTSGKAKEGPYHKVPKPCDVSAECRVDVPASEFPCPSA